ncbi:MAG: hypothetical protein P1U68_12955 [Verrucomicrobiales bacterium]|nr:hypothetical protein [Verrucomicrobiales bacterium]
MTNPLPSTPAFSVWSALWNPFRFFAGSTALISGIGIVLATGAIASVSSTHFDGVLDTHVGFPAPLWFFLLEGIVNWISLASCLWLGAVLLREKRAFRALDLFGTQALARWPFIITALVCLLPGVQTYQKKLLALAKSGETVLLPPAGTPTELASFWGAALVMIFVTIWFVALAWKSFRISCDARGGRAIVTFILAIVIAEVISKLLFLKVLLPLLKGT